MTATIHPINRRPALMPQSIPMRGDEGAPWTELMPLEYGLWICEAWQWEKNKPRRAHVTHIKASTKAAAQRVAANAVRMFATGECAVFLRRATVADYADMIQGGYVSRNNRE